MNAYLVVGDANTRKSSVLRSLTGCFNRSNREIALFLLDHGARLDIFAATMLGMTDAVKAILAAQPALIKTRGPHGITLIAHATAGENGDLVTFFKSLEGPSDDPAKPLTPEEMKAYLGTYTRDSGGSIIVSQTKFGLALKAESGFDCRLTRIGEHTFHPAGAPNVRITFTAKTAWRPGLRSPKTSGSYPRSENTESRRPPTPLSTHTRRTTLPENQRCPGRSIRHCC